MTSRRSILTQALTFGSAAYAGQMEKNRKETGFLDLLRMPDYAAVYTENGLTKLTRADSGWSASGISVNTQFAGKELPITVVATHVEPVRIHLRWNITVAGDPLLLGDAWERSYGDLGWRSIVPERVMPWYFLASNSVAVHGYGVKTGAGALCFWQLDAQGVSLWLDLSNGGLGVRLGGRALAAATVVTREGQPGEEPLVAARAFCRSMCEHPRLARAPVYGSNDWYYAYGKNSAEQTLRDTELITSLAKSTTVRPFTVIDMGWADGSKTFPSMAQLAKQMKERQVRPGLWIRPLEAKADSAESLLLPPARFGKLRERSKERAFDPTIPEALAIVTEKVKQPVGWGYELVKHDFSTYDLTGKWGREMGAEPTSTGWHLHDRTRTNAEVVRALYEALREAAGERVLLIGCNTVGHLGAGIFEAQRTGDDTSGRDWERTRRMGINTLAYRLPQHNTFFSVDPDCVGITARVPWVLNRQWLDLLARSGVALFVSPGPDATGAEQRAAIEEAFTRAASGGSKAEPENWFRDSAPEAWRENGERLTYKWQSAEGCLPFDI